MNEIFCRAPAVPAHIPAALIKSFDFTSVPGLSRDPYALIAGLRQGPRIFYTPKHYMYPGSWVLTRAEDIRQVLQNPAIFSSKGVVNFSALIGESWDLIPLGIDGARHTAFRALLNPLFSPKAVAQLDDAVRHVAGELIDAVKDAGRCDFAEDFARRFPIYVILQLIGLPRAQCGQFLAWEDGLIHGDDLDTKIAAAKAIAAYLREQIADRRAAPRQDLISFVVHSEIEGRPLTDDEVIGICYLLFVGGLDTVTASLGFHFLFLAQHPEEQQRLRDDPQLIPAAIEELLRLYSVVQTHRQVVQDVEIAGVQMKKGDWITVPTACASRDEDEFPDPDTYDLNRRGNPHVAFAYGPHRCIGSHLARRELLIAYTEWFARVPLFRLDPATEIHAHGGATFGLDRVPLIWNLK